jgi:hypothetical protein
MPSQGVEPKSSFWLAMEGDLVKVLMPALVGQQYLHGFGSTVQGGKILEIKGFDFAKGKRRKQ